MEDRYITYFLKNFFLSYSEFKNITIGYENTCKIRIAKSNRKNPLEDIENIVWHNWQEISIPFIMNTSKAESIITKNEDGVTINYDIISAGWFLMSGAQELNQQKLDKYGRFLYKNSIQNKLNITHIPVVNYYFDILAKAIEIATSNKIHKKNKFSATITHDIDEVLSGWKHRVRTQLEKGKYLKAISYGISHLIKPFYPWKNLVELSEFNFENKVKSTFFILPKNNKAGKIKNADYPLSNTYIQKSLKKIIENKNEIGVHGSYKTHDLSNKLNEDISKLKNTILGNRFHFLQFEINKTPNALSNCNLKYDTTLGFQEHIGFRNNICTPFFLYDFVNKKTTSVIEIPLNVMDCTLEYDHYMGLNQEESLEEIKKLVNEIKKFNGNLCLNWHNTYFSDYLKSDWKKLYTEIIELLRSENCLFVTCKELCELVDS